MILLDASLRISVVAAIVALILTLMRVRASGLRHTAWTIVLVAMLLMPVLPSIVPSIRMPLAARPAAVLPGTAGVRTVSTDPIQAAATYRDAPGSQPISSARQPRPLERALDTPDSAWSIWSLVITAYVLGTILLLLRLIIGWRAATRLARSASPIPLDWAAPVRESRLLATPLTAGVLAPTIILPNGWKEWPAEKLRACLAHELAHIQRRDPLVAFVAQINRCVFWFHPLAWWLERTLAIHAEDAADEAAVRAIGNRRHYAEVLLDIADAVRRGGGRVAWQAVGAGGTGLLGRRVDRVLRGETGREIPRVRRAVVFVTCVAVITIVAACRQQRTAPPLQPDAALAERLEKEKAEAEVYERAKSMTAAEVDALERSLTRTPADFEALKKLRHFYQVSGQKVFGWNEMTRRRLPHVLWVIENHPEHELATWWLISAQADPVGYNAAKERWRAQTAKPDASEKVLINAAHFFTQADAPLAEQLLLRARGMTTAPERQRAVGRRLGTFYAHVILGATDPRNGSPLTPFDSDPYAREVRRRLAESNDAPLLAAAGERLVRIYGDDGRRQFGIELLQRAVQLDPQEQNARALLIAFEQEVQRRSLYDTLRTRKVALAGGQIAAKLAARQPLTPEERTRLSEAEPQAVFELPELERFELLPELANREYMAGEDRDWNKDAPAAAAAFARSKNYAQDALALAPKFRDHPDYGKAVYHATVALAAHALRESDKNTAVRHMLAAAKAPPSRGLETRSFGLDGRVVNYLLKEGERETVVEFLERSAELRPAEREQLLTDAAAIRAGRMPMSFQYMMSRR